VKKALLFVNKKKQKNFICFLTGAVPTPREAEQKSFLVLFFKKELLLLSLKRWIASLRSQ